MESKLERLNNMTSKKLARSMVYISSVIYFATFFSISAIDFILKSSLTSVSRSTAFLESFLHNLILVGPAIFLSTIVVLVLLRPILKIMIQEEKGSKIIDKDIIAADKRINSMAKLIYIINIIFALVYFIVVSDVTKIENLLQMLNNLSIFFLCATVINVSFQELLVKPKTMLKKHTIEGKKGQWLVRNVQHLFFFVSMILIFSTLFYVASFTLKELGIQLGRSIQPFIDSQQDLTESGLLNTVTITGDTITFIFIKIMVLLFLIISLSHYSIEVSRKSQTVILKGLLHDLGSGNADLTKRVLIVQNDEMGDISSELNRLLGNLQKMFTSMKKESEKVVHSTNNLGSVLEQTLSVTSQNISSLDSIESVTNSSSQVVNSSSETVDEMFTSLNKIHQNVLTQLSSVQETSSAMEETDANIKSVGNITKQAFKITEDLNNLTSEGKNSVVNSMNAVKDIEVSVDAVNTLVFEISKIIAQTNILAMNAAIEAAHAGEVGKGFAVVASEVRKLADNSSKKLVNISENMKVVMENVNNGVSLSVSANNSLEKIDGMSKQTVQLMTSLDSAMNEQTQATSDILNAVQSLADSTKSIHSLTEIQQQQNEHVKDSLNRSTDAFNNIQNGTYEIISNNREVLSGINNLKDVIKSNQDVVNQMNSLIKGYKI